MDEVHEEKANNANSEHSSYVAYSHKEGTAVLEINADFFT